MPKRMNFPVRRDARRTKAMESFQRSIDGSNQTISDLQAKMGKKETSQEEKDAANVRIRSNKEHVIKMQKHFDETKKAMRGGY